MAFWLDRFRRKDEEDIWEELRQMLINSDKYEAEKKLQEARELEAFNRAWDKANEVSSESISQKEPYLKYEELFPQKESNGTTTGLAAPIKEGQAIYEKHLTPYEEIDSREDWSDEFKALKKAEIAKIQQAYEAREKEINREHILKQAKNYGGAALEIGSAFVPGYGGAKLAGTVAKKLAPKVGRKIAQEIATGTLKGASSGTVEGLGRGLLEDENPLKTAIQDTITSATLGAGLGTVGANVQKAVRGNKFRKIDSIEDFNQAQIKNLRKDATNYYDDYIKGTTVKRKDMDDIYFGNAGIGELRSKSLHNVGILPDLKKQIKTGTKKLPKYDYEREDIKGFDIIQNSKNGKTYEYQIANDKVNGNKFYMVKDITKTDSFPTNWDQHPGSGKSPNNIIQPSYNNLNPSQQSIQKPLSHNEWLEKLKRRRKKGWW